MADHEETLMEKIAEKLHHGDDSSSSSSDSDDEKKKSPPPSDSKPKKESSPPAPAPAPAPAPKVKKVHWMFGEKKPVHKVFGGGKPADVFLWRNKKISAGILGGVTAIWVLFELLEYHLLSLVCHALILALAVLFLWSNASTFINKSPPRIPEVHIPEEAILEFASALRIEINQAIGVLREIATGRDLKMFLSVIVGLWILSIVGSCWNFLTLFYIAFVMLHTVPVLYEKYEDQVDAFSEKAMIEIKKQYAVFDAKVLSKVPRGPLKDKKKA